MTRCYFLAIFSALLLASFACAQEPPAGGQPVEKSEAKPQEQKAVQQPLQLGDALPATFVLKDIDGVEHKAAGLKGKITVVDFFSITCHVHAAWNDRLAALQQDFASQGVSFLFIDSNVQEIGEKPPATEPGKQAFDNIRQHLKDKSLPFSVLVDHGNIVADLFAARTTPQVYVFAADGKLVYRGLVDNDQQGSKAERTSYVRSVLTKLVVGEKVEPSSNKSIGCSIKRVAVDGQRGGSLWRGSRPPRTGGTGGTGGERKAGEGSEVGR